MKLTSSKFMNFVLIILSVDKIITPYQDRVNKIHHHLEPHNYFSLKIIFLLVDYLNRGKHQSAFTFRSV